MTREWNDLPWYVHDVMKELGNFGPTLNPEHGLVKGYMNEEKTYMESADLRRISKALSVVADWLDERKVKE